VTLEFIRLNDPSTVAIAGWRPSLTFPGVGDQAGRLHIVCKDSPTFRSSEDATRGFAAMNVL
jgi:hypothetical protein